jgi:hypothetical protein
MYRVYILATEMVKKKKNLAVAAASYATTNSLITSDPEYRNILSVSVSLFHSLHVQFV